MSTYATINPETFIDRADHQPEHGRGAWTRTGIGGDYRYGWREGIRVGNEAQLSLAHWAVSAGVRGIQARLEQLGLLTDLPENRRGIYTGRVGHAVRAFQDREGLDVDGKVGILTARALWTPVIDSFTAELHIPDRLLRGVLNLESALDPGAVGWFIYYGADLRYGGVDRGMGQINSAANPQVTWVVAFQPNTSIEWTARRLRTSFDRFTVEFSDRPPAMRWDAAVCAHNSPARAQAWLEDGAPSPEAAAYVDKVRKARY